jgi:predicted anti-sigma-YlaC factor YlaD
MREAISADLDGEELPVRRAALERHLVGCAACREFRSAAAGVDRAARLGPAPVVPDLTSRAMFAIAGEQAEPASMVQGLRLGLATIGLVQLSLSLPALLFGSDAGISVHQARHLGSFGVALAVGLLVAAWRPERTSGLLPLVTALVVCLVASAVVDVTTGYAAPASELTHIVEVLGLLNLWLLDRTQRSPAPELRTA